MDDEPLASMSRKLQLSIENTRLFTWDDLSDNHEDENSEHDTPDDADDKSDDDINFYPNLLMDLLPSMEQVYSQAIKDEGNTQSISPQTTRVPRIAMQSPYLMDVDGENELGLLLHRKCWFSNHV